MLEAILHINIAQSLFAAIIILTKRPLQITDKLLSVWLFFVMILFAVKLVFIIFPEQISGYWFGKGGIVTLSFPPFLYLYSKYLIVDNSRFLKKDLLHFIPFLSISLISIILLSYSDLGVEFNTREELDWFVILFGVTFLATFLAYGTFTIMLVNKYQSLKDEYYSHRNVNISMKWIRILVIVFYSYYTLAILLGIINLYHPLKFQTSYILFPSYTFLIYFISFKGYKQIKLFSNPSIEIKPEESYKKSGLKNEEKEKYAQVILDLMEKERPWLSPEVTVNDIFIRTKIPQHYITQVLNEVLKKNFYTLVNEYRTEEVKRLMGLPQYKNWTIVSIAYEAGFNSKSSFNTFFKKHTGVTPSEYRKSIV